jgi:DNA-binding transcriptional LysR family regulator
VELRQLRYFDAVARHGGFTRAARQLLVAQPAVSAQIRRLEKELGAELLVRTTRSVELTQAGRVFLDHVRRVLAELESAGSDLDALAGLARGTLRIGATPLLGPIDLPATIVECRRRLPGLRVTLRTGLIAELVAELENAELDAVLGPIHDDLPATLTGAVLAPERLVLAVPPGHRLAGSTRRQALAAFRDEPFVCLRTGSGLHTILTDAAAAAGFTPLVDFETDTPAGVRALVSAGLGVALLAGSVAQAPGPPIHVVPLRTAPPHPPLGLIRRKPAQPRRDLRPPSALDVLTQVLDGGYLGTVSAG